MVLLNKCIIRLLQVKLPCSVRENHIFLMHLKQEATRRQLITSCMSLALNVKKKVPDKYTVRTANFVTVNLRKRCKQMQNDLKVIHHKLTLYGCSACWLNFLGKDITLPQVISHIAEIRKYFPNHHAAEGLL